MRRRIWLTILLAPLTMFGCSAQNFDSQSHVTIPADILGTNEPLLFDCNKTDEMRGWIWGLNHKDAESFVNLVLKECK